MKSYINVFFAKKEIEECIDLSEFTVEEFIDCNKKARCIGQKKQYKKGKKSLIVLYFIDDMLDSVVEYPYSEFKQDRKGNEFKENE